MLRVTIELLPHGSLIGKKLLGECYIINTGDGTPDRGDYTFKIAKWTEPPRVWKKGRVERFPRLMRGPWDLLYLCLRAAVGGRNE